MENATENATNRQEHALAVDGPVLLVSLGEASEMTQGQGQGHSEDKRRAYN